MAKKASNLSQGQIKTFNQGNELIQQLKEDIKTDYQETPIIIYYDANKEQEIIDIIKQNQFNRFIKGFGQEIKKEIRSWNYGILLLKQEQEIGIDCKFQKDSIVLITNQMKSEAQNIQTQGRRSRARGLVSQESIYQILKNMRNQQNNEIQELERLIKVVWNKREHHFYRMLQIIIMMLKQKYKIQKA